MYWLMELFQERIFLNGGSESYEIGSYVGQVISFQYNVAGSGNWASENSYVIIDAGGKQHG